MTDAAPAKSPLVWLDMDQRQLDDAYDQGVWAPNRDQVLARYQTNSARARTFLGEPRREAYGPTDAERLDIFTASRSGGPIQVFIHGGGWRGGLAADYAQLAELFVGAGAALVIPDFAPIGDFGGDLRPMVDQVRRAVRWVHEHAASIGGDPNRIFLMGHSSGALLGGCLVTTDWVALGLPSDLLKGALLVSGMYDRKPVRLSKRSEYVAFTDEIEHALSPQRHLDRLGAPVLLSYGTYESPEFQRQTRELHAAMQAAGKASTLLVADGYNHVEIVEAIASPYGLLGRAVLRQMGLAADSSIPRRARGRDRS
jgi:arylformamidase